MLSREAVVVIIFEPQFKYVNVQTHILRMKEPSIPSQTHCCVTCKLIQEMRWATDLLKKEAIMLMFSRPLQSILEVVVETRDLFG